MTAKLPGARHQITLVPHQQFLHLSFALKNDAEARSTPAARISMLAPNFYRFFDHVPDDAQVSRLALLMVAIINHQLRQMANPAASPPQPQLEFIICRVQE